MHVQAGGYVGGRYIGCIDIHKDVRMDACVGRYVGGLTEGCLCSLVSEWTVERRRVYIHI
jgi:hypothetical protein